MRGQETMSFKYFNPTDLAFGQRLTAAFTELNNLAASAEENLSILDSQIDLVELAGYRHYQVPIPRELTDPCRSNELYQLLTNKFMAISKFIYEDGKFQIVAYLFNDSTMRITRLEGSSTITEGFVYYKEAYSIAKNEGELVFSEEENFTLGNLFCQYKIDTKKGKIYLIDYNQELDLIPFDWGNITDIKWGEQVAGANELYKPTDYKCLCIKGHRGDIEVKINGKSVFKGKGSTCTRHHIVYANPSTEISGTYEWIKEIVYY